MPKGTTVVGTFGYVASVDKDGNVIGGSPSTSDATAANQTATQAAPGNDATTATAVQGVTNG